MKVGVIGAGTMGAGIAQAFAVTDGYEVVLCDIKQEFADGGKEMCIRDRDTDGKAKKRKFCPQHGAKRPVEQPAKVAEEREFSNNLPLQA